MLVVDGQSYRLFGANTPFPVNSRRFLGTLPAFWRNAKCRSNLGVLPASWRQVFVGYPLREIPVFSRSSSSTLASCCRCFSVAPIPDYFSSFWRALPAILARFLRDNPQNRF